MRLKDVASVNLRTLDENTPGDYAFKYIDISSVSFENGIDLGQDIVFSQAPSRARRIVKKGDVLVSTVRTYLRAIADIDWDAENVVASTGFAVFSPNDNIIPRFMAFAVKSTDVINQICANSKGVSYPAIQAPLLAAVEIPYFDIPKQAEIAEYLNKECEKIGRNIELLERKADAYKRLRRSIINRAVTRGLNPNAPLKPSGIDWVGDIPEHWNVSRFANYFSEHTISNKGINHQNLLSLSFGNIVRKNIDTCDGLLPASFETYQIVKPGNIILRFTDLQNDHRSLRVGLVKEEGIITSAYTCVVGNYDTIPKFSFYLLHSYDIKKVFYKLGGGMRQTLNYKTTKDMGVVMPPLEEQKEIVAYLDEKCGKIDAIIEKIGTQIERLKELKRSLINEVVTGKRAIINQ